MQHHWLKKEGHEALALFCLGWAADYAVVEHVDLPGCDALCLYDYIDSEGTLSLDVPLQASAALHNEVLGKGEYKNIYLFAWSFGVWVAERVFANYPFTRAVALNGTPLPMDERYGIGARRMSITIRGLAQGGGMEPFERRAYGEYYDCLRDKLSPRALAHNIAELEALARAAATPQDSALKWDKAIVGEKDAIFPPENMLRYWTEVRKIEVETLPLPHYPFAQGRIVADEISER